MSARSHGPSSKRRPAVCRYPGEIEFSSAVTRSGGGLRGWPIDLEAGLRVAATERKREHHGRLRGHWVGLQPFEHARVETHLRLLVVTRERQHQFDGHEVGGAEAGIDGAQPGEAGQHQPGANQQHQRERHLRDDHHVARAGACRAGASAVLQIGVQLGLRRAAATAPGRTARRPPAWPQTQTARRASRASRRPAAAGSPAPRRSAAATPNTRRAGRPTPPATASTRLSVSSCRISRPRPAPSAVRTAISRRRAAPRATSSPATFAQAISSTNPTAPSTHQQRGAHVRDHARRERLRVERACRHSSARVRSRDACAPTARNLLARVGQRAVAARPARRP